MPRIGEMIESKFLKKEDVGTGKLFTISAVKQHNVAAQGAEPEMKWCAEFDDIDKPLVLNSTNLHLIEAALGSDNTDDWIGKPIVVFEDANVSFGGKVVGGVRVDVNRTKRYHAKQADKAKATEKATGTEGKVTQMKGRPGTATADDFEDDIPY